jgi:hypothetical protein
VLDRSEPDPFLDSFTGLVAERLGLDPLLPHAVRSGRPYDMHEERRGDVMGRRP